MHPSIDGDVIDIDPALGEQDGDDLAVLLDRPVTACSSPSGGQPLLLQQVVVSGG
ncbi:MAG: hypothetical protein M3186_06380 [Actinomycetota bacterium]|nr:hypothetical protein [Actinomycetota bacterium]